MKSISKLLSVTLSCIMVLLCATTTVSALEPDIYTSNTTEEYYEIPIVCEGSNSITPYQQGDIIHFSLGSVGYMSSCGNTPKFKCWVTGGSADTQVKFEFLTSGGSKYGPFGPVRADGSESITKPFVVINGGGTWQISAYITSGSDSGNIVCHVEQVY